MECSTETIESSKGLARSLTEACKHGDFFAVFVQDSPLCRTCKTFATGHARDEWVLGPACARFLDVSVLRSGS